MTKIFKIMLALWFKQYLFREEHTCICKYNTSGTGSDGKPNAYTVELWDHDS